MAGPALPIGAHLQVPGQADYVTDDGDVRGGVHIVADTTARDAIPVAMRKQGMVAHLFDGSEYQLGSDLTTWTNISASLTGIQSVTGLAGIKALSNASTGALIRETSLGELWQKQPAGTATADDITVVTVTDVSCQFHRIVGSGPVAKWREQAAWYVDGAAGNDWDTGASGHAIKSVDEILNNPGRCFLRLMGANSGVTLTISGTVTNVATTTVSAFANYSHGVYGSTQGTPTIVSGTSISDWTSYSLGAYRLASGDKLAWVDKVSAAGGGISTIGSSPWGYMSLTGAMFYNVSAPTTGDQLLVQTLSSIDYLDVEFSGASGNGTNPHLIIRDLTFNYGVRLGKCIKSAMISVYGCNFASGSATDALNNFGIGSSAQAVSCRFNTNVGSWPLLCSGCYFLNANPQIGGIASDNYIEYSLSRTTSGTSATFYSRSGPSRGSLRESQGFSFGGNVLQFIDPGINISINGVSGVAGSNKAGILLKHNSLIDFNPSLAYNIQGGSGAGELAISATPTLGVGGFKFSDCLSGLVVGEWSGSGNLSDSGSGYAKLDVTLSPALTDMFPAGSQVSVQRVDPVGDIGDLSIPTASRTTSAFQARSQSPTDTSKLDWFARSKVVTRAYIFPQSVV